MSDEYELAEEQSTLPVDAIPGYLILKDGPLKDEARRAHIMPFLVTAEGFLVKDWDDELLKIEAILRDGRKIEKPKRGAHLEVAK